MGTEALCKSYLEALGERKLECVLPFFASDAVVHSPMYGTVSVDLFFQKLFAAPWYLDVRFQHLFLPASFSSAVALHVLCRARSESGRETEFECVAIMELDVGRKQFKRLTNIYDSAPIRELIAVSD